MTKYQRYDKRYNGVTSFTAVNRKRRWTAAEEARLLMTWCLATASSPVRINVAVALGRTYVACAKRHSYLHRLNDDGNECCANQRRLGS